MEKVIIGNCTLYNGDCQEVIKELEDNSVTLIHTDPPYIIHSDDNMGAMMEKKARKSYDKLINADISDGFEKNPVFFQMAVERLFKEILFINN